MVQEERVKLRVEYMGADLYDSLVSIDGVVREEYVDSYDVEDGLDEAVMFTCDIVFNSDSVSRAFVVQSVQDITGVESVRIASEM